MVEQRDSSSEEKGFRDSPYYWPLMIFLGFSPAIFLVLANAATGVVADSSFAEPLSVAATLGAPIVLYVWSRVVLRGHIKGRISLFFSRILLAFSMLLANAFLALAGCSVLSDQYPFG